MPRVKKIIHTAIVLLLVLACWSDFGLVMFLDGHYYRTRPRQPDPATGRIYPHYVKTLKDVARVYVTRTEKLPSESLFYVCTSLFAAAYLLNKRWKVLRKPGEARTS
jgi:hypothetical protein